jgi:hypothetical protein
LFYYVLRSKAGIDSVIWRSLKAKKNFNIKGVSVDDLKVGKNGQTSNPVDKPN